MKKNLIFILFLTPILCFGQIVTGQTLGSKNGISTPSKILGKNGIFIPTRKQSISVVVPTVTTITKSVIDFTSEGAGGNVTSDGGATVTARGVCWGTSANPTVSGSHTTNGTGTGIFTSTVTGLDTTSTWHFRAYATNSAGTGYGGDSTFQIRTNTLLYHAWLKNSGGNIIADNFIPDRQTTNTLGQGVSWNCSDGVLTSGWMGHYNNELQDGSWAISVNPNGDDVMFTDATGGEGGSGIVGYDSGYYINDLYTIATLCNNDGDVGCYIQDGDGVSTFLQVFITHKIPYNP
jgi:hypothetical protein